MTFTRVHRSHRRRVFGYQFHCVCERTLRGMQIEAGVFDFRCNRPFRLSPFRLSQIDIGMALRERHHSYVYSVSRNIRRGIQSRERAVKERERECMCE